MNYGLRLRRAKRHHWVMGTGRATQKLGADAGEINPEGNWSKYDSEKELQRRNGLETMNCTNFGTYLALIALSKLKGFKLFPGNCSERYSGVGTGTSKSGNDPWKVAEKLSTELGAIHEKELPFSDNINEWDEYYSPKLGTPEWKQLLAKGQEVLRKYEIEPEWVIPPFTKLTTAQKHQRIRTALRRGPVCVSVEAWNEQNGVYVKSGQDNHWVWLTHFEGDRPIVRDQYSPFRKVLSPDYDFGAGILYFMRENVSGVLPKDKPLAIRIIKELIKLFTELMPQIAPVAVPEPSKREILYNWSKASIGRDLTPTDSVPDEVACVAQLQAVFFKAFSSYIGDGAARYNTLALLQALQKDPRFKMIPPSEALFGDIAVAPTGKGKNPKEHGHCWIVGKHDWMSNDSDTGLWKANYTKDAVFNVFVKERGFPLYVFRT